MRELFTIGEMAKLFQTNIRTLRYYDEIGLLKPEWRDDNSGYRYYSTKQFERMNTIKYLRALDMPLDHIAHFFDRKETDTLKSLLREQQREIQNRIQEFHRIGKKIQRRLHQIDDALNAPLYEIHEIHLPPRKAAILRQSIPIEDDLEYPIRQLERANDLEGLMFLGDVGVSMDQQQILLGDYKNFSAIFVLLEDEEFPEAAGIHSFIREGDYAVIRFRGKHTEANRYYRQLLEYFHQNHYMLCGDSVEITLIDYGITNDPNQFVTEIQLPFQKTS